jgi:hypothetical protein
LQQQLDNNKFYGTSVADTFWSFSHASNALQ